MYGTTKYQIVHDIHIFVKLSDLKVYRGLIVYHAH